MLGYLDELDGLLGQQDLAEPVRLYIGGGAAMSTMYAQRLTNDVDVMSEGMTAEVRAAAEQISQRHAGLDDRWLNDDAKVVRVNVPMDERLIFEGRNLSVYAAGPRYLLAAKLTANRRPPPAKRISHRVTAAHPPACPSARQPACPSARQPACPSARQPSEFRTGLLPSARRAARPPNEYR